LPNEDRLRSMPILLPQSSQEALASFGRCGGSDVSFRIYGDPGVPRTGDLFTEALHEARFADPRLAHYQRHLAFTVEGAFPTIYQQAKFVLSPDELGQSTRRRCRFEPSSHSARLDYSIKLDWPFDTLERLRSPIFDHEQPGDQDSPRRPKTEGLDGGGK